MSLARTLSAELLKLKRTLAFRMIIVAPLLVATLQFFVLWNQKRFPDGFKLWEMLPRNVLSLWAVFMLPLFITLETALLNGLEHSEKQWKAPVRAARAALHDLCGEADDGAGADGCGDAPAVRSDCAERRGAHSPAR